jgi:predicted aspartyl protease
MRGWARSLVGVLGLLVVPGVLLASDNQSEIPFRFYRGYMIVVHGSIGDLDKLNLLIDTGAVPSVVDQRVARKLRLEGRRERLSVFSRDVRAQRVALPELRLGPIRAQSLEVLVRDLSFISEELGVRIDALVGLDVLGRSNFSIRYQPKKIAFGPVEPCDSAMEFQAGPGFAYVILRVQDQPVHLMVDTGSRDLVFFESRIRGRLSGLRVLGNKTSSNMGGEVRLSRVRLSDVRLGPMQLETQDAVLMAAPGGEVPGFDGLLGVASLGLKRIDFDFQRRTISWEK